jgi:hypothetical protein
MAVFDQARMFARFASGLPRFLRHPISLEQARHIVAQDNRERESNFLLLMRRAIYANAHGPYRALLDWAAVEYGDLESGVRKDGIEATLEKLFDAGVRISLDEFKGNRPIARRGLTIETSPGCFDNPLLAREFEVATGGTTGQRRRLAIDFDLLVHETALQLLYYSANGFATRPRALWRAIPPGSAGLKNALRAAKTGHPLARWFSPQPFSFSPVMLPSAAFTSYALACGWRMGGLIPRPEYTPLDKSDQVARWAADMVRAGNPPGICLPAGSAVRVSRAALETGFDISGTLFRVGNEPLTPGKYEAIRKAGAETFSGWSLSEAGMLGGACAHREAIDEVHLFTAKTAFLERPAAFRGGAETIHALHLTTLLPATPIILLNVDSGDYGVLSRRRCGCPLEEAGFDLHLHTIRNYEKLTAGGMHFVGTQLAALVEEHLPRAFGGVPTDFQFIEEEEGAASRVTVVVSPRLGPLDDERILTTVLEKLGDGSRGNDMMAAQWRQGAVLRVTRREPYVTPAAKTPPVWVVGQRDRAQRRPGES